MFRARDAPIQLFLSRHQFLISQLRKSADTEYKFHTSAFLFPNVKSIQYTSLCGSSWNNNFVMTLTKKVYLICINHVIANTWSTKSGQYLNKSDIESVLETAFSCFYFCDDAMPGHQQYGNVFIHSYLFQTLLKC